MDNRNPDPSDILCQEGESDEMVQQIKDEQKRDCLQKVIIQVDKGGSLSIIGSAQRGKQRGNAGSYLRASDQRDGRSKSDSHGEGKSLQDTDHGIRALYQHGKYAREQKSQNRIAEADQHIPDRRDLT